MGRRHLYQHFSISDKDFIDQSLDLISRVEERYVFQVTRFLDPHKARILETLANRAGIQFFSSLEIVQTELVKVILAPDYYVLDEADFDMVLLEIQYPNKFYTLRHGQIMGTLLNQLGIERSTFGDILLDSTKAQIFVERKFSTFFMDHVTKIAKVPVTLKQVPFSDRLEVQTQVRTRDILVSSLRLDKIISCVLKISRSDATRLIHSKKVKVNYDSVEQVDFHLNLQDLVSVRGFGRFKIVQENGLSKNDKHKLTVEVITSK